MSFKRRLKKLETMHPTSSESPVLVLYRVFDPGPSGPRKPLPGKVEFARLGSELGLFRRDKYEGEEAFIARVSLRSFKARECLA